MMNTKASEKSSESETFLRERRKESSVVSDGVVSDEKSVLRRKRFCMDLSERFHNKRGQKALAVLEAAVWLVVGLPVALLSVLITGLVYDQNILRTVPVDTLRSVTLNPLLLRAGSAEFEFEVDEPALRVLLPQLLKTATTRALTQSMNIRRVSARACFWSYAVNTQSGFVRGQLREVCSSIGGSGAGLSFAEEIRSKTAEQIGSPLYGSGGGFIDKVVLIGVKIAGEVNDFGLASAYSAIEFGAVQVPRQEVTL